MLKENLFYELSPHLLLKFIHFDKNVFTGFFGVYITKMLSLFNDFRFKGCKHSGKDKCDGQEVEMRFFHFLG